MSKDQTKTPGAMVREERYLVIKLNKMNCKREYECYGVESIEKLVGSDAIVRGGLVIESDWPEYEPAWRMIEARVNGTEQPPAAGGEQVARMPVERCYDVRAKMIIAFNEAKKAGGDLDDQLDAAYKSALRFSPNPQTQPATAKLEMADVVKAHMEIPHCPVLTSNQCHALAMKLNAKLNGGA